MQAIILFLATIALTHAGLVYPHASHYHHHAPAVETKIIKVINEEYPHYHHDDYHHDHNHAEYVHHEEAPAVRVSPVHHHEEAYPVHHYEEAYPFHHHEEAYPVHYHEEAYPVHQHYSAPEVRIVKVLEDYHHHHAHPISHGW